MKKKKKNKKNKKKKKKKQEEEEGKCTDRTCELQKLAARALFSTEVESY